MSRHALQDVLSEIEVPEAASDAADVARAPRAAPHEVTGRIEDRLSHLRQRLHF